MFGSSLLLPGLDLLYLEGSPQSIDHSLQRSSSAQARDGAKQTQVREFQPGRGYKNFSSFPDVKTLVDSYLRGDVTLATGFTAGQSTPVLATPAEECVHVRSVLMLEITE